MSNIVWSASKGWHDGPEVKVTPRLRPNADVAAAMHKVAAAPVQAAANGHCLACGALEVRLTGKVLRRMDLSSIGESAAYPTGYGCELCD